MSFVVLVKVPLSLLLFLFHPIWTIFNSINNNNNSIHLFASFNHINAKTQMKSKSFLNSIDVDWKFVCVNSQQYFKNYMNENLIALSIFRHRLITEYWIFHFPRLAGECSKYHSKISHMTIKTMFISQFVNSFFFRMILKM